MTAANDAPLAGGAARRALHGSVAGVAAFVANLAQAVLVVPVLLGAWGPERYGLWLALQSLFVLLTTLDTGHHTYVGNELLRLLPLDRAAARRVLASGLLGAGLLGGLELLALGALILGGLVPWALGQSGQELPANSVLAFALLVLGWVVQGSAGGVWARLYPAGGQYARSVWWGVAYRLLQTLVLVVAVWLGAGILGAVLVSTLAALGYSLLSFADVRRRFGGLYPFWRGASPRLAFGNVARSMVVTACALAAQLQQHGVVWLLSWRLGLGVIAALSTTRTLANVFLQASAVVTGPLVPEMVRLSALREHAKLAGLLRAIWLVTTAPVNLGLCLGLPFYEPLYRAWTGGAMVFDGALFAWLGVSISLRCFGAPLVAMIAGLNALRAQVWLAATQSAVVLGVLGVFGGGGLAAAGAAIALGELCGSVVLPVLLMRRVEPEIMRRLPVRALLLAALPSGVLAGGLWAAARGAAPLGVLAVVVPLAGLFYFVQWLDLGRPMQERLLALVRQAMGQGRARAERRVSES
jgi:O-antigen/teichoic acid export membrane protein